MSQGLIFYSTHQQCTLCTHYFKMNPIIFKIGFPKKPYKGYYNYWQITLLNYRHSQMYELGHGTLTQ